MSTCVHGLGDVKLTDDSWDEILYGVSAQQAAVIAPHSMGSMNVSAGLTAAQKGQAFDYTWLMYAGLAIAAVMLLSKGRR